MKTGIIKDIEAPAGSGGLTIILEDETRLFGDNTMIVRAFEEMFGDVIQAGHCFDPSKVIGKKIQYSVDAIGIMEYIDKAAD